jgi:hypothetical protein
MGYRLKTRENSLAHDLQIQGKATEKNWINKIELYSINITNLFLELYCARTQKQHMIKYA